MRAVNLASKPFVNRRPVIRVAGLVWVLAAALAAANVWLYGDFFRSAASHRSRLADLETAIDAEQQRNADLRKKIGDLKLDENNSTALYLNGLIHQRIFPWSRLFDDIEDVLPKDVYLTGLAPQIQKVEKIKIRTTPTRASRARSGRNQQPQPRRPPKVLPEKDIDRVAMTIAGFSRSDEAMLDLVDRLYASPTFLDPVLAGEKRDPQTGLVSFSIAVTYLTRAKLAEPVAVGALADAGGAAGTAGGAAGTAGGELADGTVGGGTLADAVAGGLAGRNADGRNPDVRGGLQGEPGFTAGGAAGSAGGARPATRPGFDAVDGGTQDSRGGAAGSGGAAGRRTGRNGETILQPGFANPDLRGPGAAPGDVVVPPRRTPGSLQPSVSATPGLRGGG